MSLSFLGLTGKLADSDQSPIVVVPIPLEKTTSYQKGTKGGPMAILKASDYLEFFDPYFDQQSCRVGIATDHILDCRPKLGDCVEKIYQRASYWYSKNKFPIFLGGEHSISIGIFKALKEIKGPVTILQIDAHADLRESYHGSPLNHACVMARAREYGHKIVQCGIRALSQEEAERTKQDNNIYCFYDHDYHWRCDDFKQVIDCLSGPTYLTIDVDGLSPTDIPSTGTPVPGGLTWKEINLLIENLFDKVEVIGADINEHKPSKEFKHCDFYLASLAYRIMGHKAVQEGWELKGDMLSGQI